MELMQAIVTRRATREYHDTPVAQARIEQCINAANLAPSAMNRQPWAFAVIANPDRIEDYACRAKLWLLQDVDEKPELSSLKPLLESPGYSLLHRAPALVLILATSNDQQAAEDCCLAGQNFMLAARDGAGNLLDRSGSPVVQASGHHSRAEDPGKISGRRTDCSGLSQKLAGTPRAKCRRNTLG
jgi:nitroreductase family protein